MDLRPMIQILSDGAFHAGNALAQQLGITRTLVGRQIESLREMGIEIHSVTGKGYRLPTSLELLSVARIFDLLGEDQALWKGRFELLLSTRSTNEVAMEKARDGETQYVVFAEHQSQGRGRRGRHWVSPLGANIAMSVLWTFEHRAARLEGLSLAVAVMVVDALQSCAHVGMGVKWPNDILLGGSKLAGILIEISGDPEGPSKVVIGIGINVRMPFVSAESIDQAFTDLASNSLQLPDRHRIVTALLCSLNAGLAVFATQGFTAFKSRWNELDVYKGRSVEIISGAQRRQGVAAGVDNAGNLRLETGSGVITIAGGELMPSLRPLQETEHDDS